MTQRLLLAILVAGALATAACGGSDSETTDGPGDVAFELEENGDAGVAGVRATLTYESRDATRVVVDGLDEGEPAGGGANPVWLGRGTCDSPEDVVFALEELSGSTSETTVELGLPALLNGDYVIAVGLTPDQPDVIACGDVPDGK